jgi:hypothetical protein
MPIDVTVHQPHEAEIVDPEPNMSDPKWDEWQKRCEAAWVISFMFGVRSWISEYWIGPARDLGLELIPHMGDERGLEISGDQLDSLLRELALVAATWTRSVPEDEVIVMKWLHVDDGEDTITYPVRVRLMHTHELLRMAIQAAKAISGTLHIG